MDHKEFLDKCVEHKSALIFAAGVATAVVGAKVLKSKTFKDTTAKGMATVMSVKRDAEECFQDMKETAEDIIVDANEDNKKEIYVESKDD